MIYVPTWARTGDRAKIHEFSYLLLVYSFVRLVFLPNAACSDPDAKDPFAYCAWPLFLSICLIDLCFYLADTWRFDLWPKLSGTAPPVWDEPHPWYMWWESPEALKAAVLDEMVAVAGMSVLAMIKGLVEGDSFPESREAVELLTFSRFVLCRLAVVLIILLPFLCLAFVGLTLLGMAWFFTTLYILAEMLNIHVIFRVLLPLIVLLYLVIYLIG